MSTNARQSATTSRFNPQHVNYLSASVLAAVCLGSLLRWAVLDWGDGLRCDGYLARGEWLDPGTWKNWQPEGCMHVPLDSASISKCFPSPSPAHSLSTSSPSTLSTSTASREILFIGDSITRQLFFSSARLADHTLPGNPEAGGGEKHSDWELVASVGGKGKGEGLTFTFWWDPFLNSSRTNTYLSTTTSNPNALLVLGSGLWYLRHPSSGGIAGWEHMIDETFGLIERGQPSMSRKDLASPPAAKALSGHALSQAIVFLPVVIPVDETLSDDRAEYINHVDVEAMNSDLAARLTPTADASTGASTLTSLPPIKIPFVFNELLVPTETEDGLHYSEKILGKQAEILFGWRCNDLASKFSGACCKTYPTIRPAQALVLIGLISWAPLALILRRRGIGKRFYSYLPQETAVMPLIIFSSAILYLFVADRTHVFLKEQKDWEPYVYIGLVVFFLAAGLGTMKKGDKDMGFLNREQTDEWKGWMQIEILIYHILGASKVSGVYNYNRIFVASYLFMTGYGHFTYYLKKKDFGFQRVAMVLFRLNLLSVVLPYTMNTDYAFYYFAPLVSWWYLIIYITMWAGNRYNDNPAFLLSKLVAVAALTTTVTHQSKIMERIFEVLHLVFRIAWSGSEWNFRVGLDMFIPYAGMLCAYAYIKAVEYRIADKPWWRMAKNSTVALSGLALVWYFWFELSRPDKFAYNASHPYISFIPICAFVVLRNATSILRSCNSRLFMFIGQCSLETFIFQYHGWMASDTHGVLLVIPGTRWRTLNLVLSTIVYIWLSNKVSIATGDITNWAVGKAKAAKRAALPGATLPLPATAVAKRTSTSEIAAATVTAAVETDGKTGGVVPESIPLMGRETPGDGKEVDNEGLTAKQEAAEADAAVDAEIEALLAGPVASEDSTIAIYAKKLGELAKEQVGVRLGLMLAALWTVNLLY